MKKISVFAKLGDPGGSGSADQNKRPSIPYENAILFYFLTTFFNPAVIIKIIIEMIVATYPFQPISGTMPKKAS